MRLLCKVLGTAGVGTVQVDTNDAVVTVRDIVFENLFKDKKIMASDLELFLARDADGWIHLGDKVVLDLQKGTVPPRVEAIMARGPLSLYDTVEDHFVPAPPSRTFHLLVRAPESATKRSCVETLFAPGPSKRLKLSAEDAREMEYFEMRSFPSMANPMPGFPRVLIRDAYKSIYDSIMGTVQDYRAVKIPMNFLVTGNPGVGKSRFYLYMIWRISAEIEKFPGLVIVTNYKDRYWRFVAARKEFVEVTGPAARALATDDKVIRLIESRSNDMDPWAGMSVLFASPGVDNIKHFCKTCEQFVMPPWRLDELEAVNSLLSDDLRLSDDELKRRIDSFGGIARWVFSPQRVLVTIFAAIDRAIATYSAFDVVEASSKEKGMDPATYQHRTLVMVPDRADYMGGFHLEFVSKEVAAKVINKTKLDALHRLSEFALLHGEESSTAVLRGFIHEELGHRWFALQNDTHLQFELLLTKANSTRLGSRDVLLAHLVKPQIVMFDTLSAVSLDRQISTMYYRPLSKNFPVVDAIIVQPNGDVFCLQFTLNKQHGVKMEVLRHLASELNVGLNRLKLVFVVPKALLNGFYRQRASQEVVQYACGLDFALGAQESTRHE